MAGLVVALQADGDLAALGWLFLAIGVVSLVVNLLLRARMR
jgi:hypothetical protein